MVFFTHQSLCISEFCFYSPISLYIFVFCLLTNLFAFPNSVFSPISLYFRILFTPHLSNFPNLFTHQSLYFSEFCLLTNLSVFPNSVYSPISLFFLILFTHQSLCISEFCLLTNLSVFPNSVYFLSFQFTTG